jgi:hypothetical protein
VTFFHKFRFGLILEAYEVYNNFSIFESQKMKFDEKNNIFFKYSNTFRHFGAYFNSQSASGTKI